MRNTIATAAIAIAATLGVTSIDPKPDPKPHPEIEVGAKVRSITLVGDPERSARAHDDVVVGWDGDWVKLREDQFGYEWWINLAQATQADFVKK